MSAAKIGASLRRKSQRAWDVEQVAARHAFSTPMSEPEAFVEFGERVPEWCVLVGLIGSGQEIHVGEEAGLGQWRQALARAGRPDGWTVHAPQRVLDEFFAAPDDDGRTLPARLHADEALDLTVELRFHFCSDLDAWVDGLLADDRGWPDEVCAAEAGAVSAHCRELAERLEAQAYPLRMTRDLEEARAYLRGRYADAPSARFGLVASSRDKALEAWGVPNGWNATKQLRLGPWYGDGELDSHYSCRHLRDCVTEFGAQGLELDGVLLAWGADLLRDDDRWSNTLAKRHARSAHVRDPFQLRLNAYRVLLTRGRDCAIIYVPPLRELDETATWLQECGVRLL